MGTVSTKRESGRNGDNTTTKPNVGVDARVASCGCSRWREVAMMSLAVASPALFKGGLFPTCRLTAALCVPMGAFFLIATRFLEQAGQKRERLTGRSGAGYILAPLLLTVGVVAGIVGVVGYILGR